jgi:hypothetical protein
MYTLSKGREEKKRFKTCFRNFSLCSLHEEMQTSNKAPHAPLTAALKLNRPRSSFEVPLIGYKSEAKHGDTLHSVKFSV